MGQSRTPNNIIQKNILGELQTETHNIKTFYPCSQILLLGYSSQQQERYYYPHFIEEELGLRGVKWLIHDQSLK